MIRVGVIGYGYWGPNLVRNFAETPGCKVAALADLRPERLALAQARFPYIRTTNDYRTLIADKRIDALAVATPFSTHFKIGTEALASGKHVFMEKPMAETRKKALSLIKEAEKVKRVLMVDHTFIYTGAIRKIKELMKRKKLGEVYYYDAVRVNLGLFQHDVNVIWDLAVHDVSVIDYVLPMRPYAVSATGMSHIAGQPENIAYLTLFFKDHLIAHIHVNWLAPVKVRRTLIGGSRKMIVYDDLEPSEKVKVYDKGVKIKTDAKSIYKMLVNYRTGDAWIPQIDITEALRTETRHFVECIEKRKKCLLKLLHYMSYIIFGTKLKWEIRKMLCSQKN